MEKVKNRSLEEKKKLTKRLKTIEGQVRGIINMVEEDRYCKDILIQMSAINKSLKSVSSIILKDHLKTCVINNIKEDNLTIMDEVIDLFNKVG